MNNPATKTTVGVVFGGANSEHEVSCSSAEGAVAHLDLARFDVVLLKIGRDGRWTRVDSVGANVIGGSLLPELADIDVVLPVLHGRFGEDGTVQGLLELAGIPYVGCGVLSSALAMDKLMAQSVLAAAGLPTVTSHGVTERTRATASEKAESLGYPVFVKPNRSGSSVGVSRVNRPEELEAALELALSFDSTALMQPLMVAEEIDLGVLQQADGELVVGEALHILTAKGSSFFDYTAKYTDGGHEFEIPAKISDEVRATLENLATSAFRILDCEGLARVDFFLSADGSIAINEVNTMPGMTALSQFPTIWQASGMSYTELLNRLIDRALVARPARA